VPSAAGVKGQMPATIVAEALDVWRDGERLLSDLAPSSSDYKAAAAAVVRVRAVYERLTSAATVSRPMASNARWVIAEARATLNDIRRREPAPIVHRGD
jgi:hypothetical protein